MKHDYDGLNKPLGKSSEKKRLYPQINLLNFKAKNFKLLLYPRNNIFQQEYLFVKIITLWTVKPPGYLLW